VSRTALITGASGAFGTGVRDTLRERGWQVVGLDLQPGDDPDVLACDVTSDEEVPRAVAQAVERLGGRLDALINNAGILEIVPLADAAPDHVRRTWETNVAGLIETTRAALPLLRKSKGAIVNLATVIADQPFANMSVYCASKAAVLALTRSWAQELASDGIRVNAVSPGPIETPMFSSEKLGITAPVLQQLGSSVIEMVPLRRFGKPAEVAHVVAFLASPAASYVTGAQYTVGGGIEA